MLCSEGMKNADFASIPHSTGARGPRRRRRPDCDGKGWPFAAGAAGVDCTSRSLGWRCWPSRWTTRRSGSWPRRPGVPRPALRRDPRGARGSGSCCTRRDCVEARADLSVPRGAAAVSPVVLDWLYVRRGGRRARRRGGRLRPPPPPSGWWPACSRSGGWSSGLRCSKTTRATPTAVRDRRTDAR